MAHHCDARDYCGADLADAMKKRTNIQIIQDAQRVLDELERSDPDAYALRRQAAENWVKRMRRIDDGFAGIKDVVKKNRGEDEKT